MCRPTHLPIEEILAGEPRTSGEAIGASRRGLPILGAVYGSGATRISLIAGCHADEPVGPRTLRLLSAHLESLPADHPLITAFSWRIVPHVNPDGAIANELWATDTASIRDHLDDADLGYDLARFIEHVVRELPGDDVEFGFPRSGNDSGARPENSAVATFLAAGGPYDLHASLHGMALAPGPWFLIEPTWIDRTLALRERLRRQSFAMGYELFDPDRGGEKGFTRIDRGFSTRPDSRAMQQHFVRRGEPEIAARFRPSSMEFVRDLGGDPLTLVSEMPLFLTAPLAGNGTPEHEQLAHLRTRLTAARGNREGIEDLARSADIRPMPIRDQQRLQLALLDGALSTVQIR